MGDISQRDFDKPFGAVASVATDGANKTLVTITVQNANGAALPHSVCDLYLSDDADGLGVTAVTASGAVGDKTAGTTGTVLAILTTKKVLRVKAIANGTYQLSITDTAKTAFYIFVIIDGVPRRVATLVTASYA